MTRRTWFLALLLAAAAASVAVPALAAGARTGFGFHATEVKGFLTGKVSLTGGGAFDLTTGTGNSGGGFSCTDPVEQGPLTGCQTGQGVRWDSDELLRATTNGIKCTGAAAEVLKHPVLAPDLLILQADFYRAGDANTESFRAQMIVSTTDIAPDIDGFQNVWIQGVGCGTAPVSIGAVAGAA
jgi:hypothetical protein